MTKANSRHTAAALITGASAGIGEALARRFASGGHSLVLVARHAARLEALAVSLQAAHGVRVFVQPADLRRAGAARTLAATLKRRRIDVEVLVNNAGVLYPGPFSATPARRLQEQIDLNVGALTAMLAQFVPPMCRRGHGRVLNVASIAAFQPVPNLATYAATKSYVLSLSEALAVELQGHGVSVTTLCPGFTATHMLRAATAANARLSALPRLLIGDAARVADEGYRACMQGEAICVPRALDEAMTLASRTAPRWLLRRLSAALARRFA